MFFYFIYILVYFCERIFRWVVVIFINEYLCEVNIEKVENIIICY